MRYMISILLLLVASLGAITGAAELTHPQQVAQAGLERLSPLEPDTEEWWKALEQLQTDLTPYESQGLHALAFHYKTHDACTVSLALGFVGRQHPQQTVSLMTSALPLPERGDDLCVLEGMVLLGPPAYPSLIACGIQDSVSSAWVCLDALIVQVSDLPDAIEAMGLLGRDGIRDPPTSQSGIRKVTKRFEAWWSANEQEVTWSQKTRRLTRNGVAH
jgi:hypothetical protein